MKPKRKKFKAMPMAPRAKAKRKAKERARQLAAKPGPVKKVKQTSARGRGGKSEFEFSQSHVWKGMAWDFLMKGPFNLPELAANIILDEMIAREEYDRPLTPKLVRARIARWKTRQARDQDPLNSYEQETLATILRQMQGALNWFIEKILDQPAPVLKKL